MELNKKFVEKVEPVIYQIWDQIGLDVLKGPDIDNEQAVEACLDSDKIEIFTGNTEIATLIREVCAIHGYGLVLNYLNKHITLY